MTTHAWQHLQTVFREAMERPPPEREAYIAQRCGDDKAVCHELRGLLAAHEQAGEFMAAPAWQTDGTPAPEMRCDDDLEGVSLLGRTIGRYRLEKVIASGGMGIVCQAVQEHPRRTVALKVMRSGIPSRAALRRFEFEVEVLGRLQHPAIAQIFEAGTFDSGSGVQPFFAMELVDGPPVTEFAAMRGLNTVQRLALFIKICQGVDHAHQKGVIHRDLKPANILVIQSSNDQTTKVQGTAERRPLDFGPLDFGQFGVQPKILDFGIARAAGTDFKTASLPGATDPGSLLGTLAYMSPEQVGGDPRGGEVDTRSDIYALGVILYELLTGRLPHANLAGTSVPEAVRTVREADPPPLSSISRVLRGDLEWITMKAMEKDRSRRYGSASELAADIARHLNHEPVLAGPPSAMYRFSKLIKRHRTAAVAVILVCVSIVGGLAATTGMYLEMRQQRDLARQQTKVARDAESEATQLFMQATTIGHVLHDFAESELSNLAGGAKARLRLAERGLAEISSLYHKRPNPDTGYGLAYAHQRVGEALAVMGRSTDALEQHMAAFDLRRQGAADRPDSEAIARALGVGHWRVADGQIPLGLYQAALENHLRSLEIHQRRNQRWPETREPILQGVYMGIAHRRIAEMQHQMGEFDQALRTFEQSLALVDAGLNADPRGDSIELLRGRSLVLRGMGEVKATLGRHEEAIKDLSASIQTLGTIAARTGPSNVYERTNQARALAIMAEVYAATNRAENAVESADRAVALAATLAEADPDNFESGHVLGRCEAAAAQAALAAGRIDNAVQRARQASLRLEGLTRHDPDHARVRRDFAIACLTADRALTRQAGPTSPGGGPPEAAAAEAARLWRERGRAALLDLRNRGRLAPIDASLLSSAIVQEANND